MDVCSLYCDIDINITWLRRIINPQQDITTNEQTPATSEGSDEPEPEPESESEETGVIELTYGIILIRNTMEQLLQRLWRILMLHRISIM